MQGRINLLRKILMCVIVVMVTGSFAVTSTFADQIVTLRSGNGSVGDTDSNVTMLVGPAD